MKQNEISEEVFPAPDEYSDEETRQVIDQVNQEMDLSAPLKRPVIGGFVDKNSLIGKKVTYSISGMTRVPNQFKTGKVKMVLQLNDEKGNKSLLDLGSDNQVVLMDKYGDRPIDWIGQEITVEFQRFKSESKGRVLEGVTWKIL